MVRSLLLRKLDHMIPNPKRKMKECSPKCIDYPAEEILWDFLLHRQRGNVPTMFLFVLSKEVKNDIIFL